MHYLLVVIVLLPLRDTPFGRKTKKAQPWSYPFPKGDNCLRTTKEGRPWLRGKSYAQQLLCFAQPWFLFSGSGP